VPAICTSGLAGTFKAEPGGLIVVSPEGVLTPAIPALIAPGDGLLWQLQIPLVEPHMPR
jgi:hypothetical protein